MMVVWDLWTPTRTMSGLWCEGVVQLNMYVCFHSAVCNVSGIAFDEYVQIHVTLNSTILLFQLIADLLAH